jgi:hypothetical protein
MLRNLGERGLLARFPGVLVARPPVSDHADRPDAVERDRRRDAQRDAVLDVVSRYNPDAVVCVGVPFGHTRPQWIVPYGGEMTLDGAVHRVWADYGPAPESSADRPAALERVHPSSQRGGAEAGVHGDVVDGEPVVVQATGEPDGVREQL